MKTFGIISAWICIAIIICGLSSIDDFSMVTSIENHLIQLLIPLMSLNMMVCTSTANSLFKYEESHKVDKNDIVTLIGEMKQAVVAQFTGVAVIILLNTIASLFKTNILEFIYHIVSMSVLVMYVWLIVDVALAFFRIIKGSNT